MPLASIDAGHIVFAQSACYRQTLTFELLENLDIWYTCLSHGAEQFSYGHHSKGQKLA